ncbi:putative D-alanine--D-alanine ligase [Halobacteriovorax marinus SJ]|uniref:D-alanine--D-alanine ligase n=1 Tax=Halobacteriovorax marinus (strain ATCC BAA-682 / DSM 15412 / SJ) TaxID=862908 RepID=E1X4R8_HALMS|nr:ATP-grasp domain-containing protein [Halobacteriovorax marinus]CBW27144.1 putative D-alanine--D-alanine ligase [Halobacteriovorax marinus SJ]
MKVLVLMHKDLVPPTDIKEDQFDKDEVPWITEYDVIKALNNLGHKVEICGVISDLKLIKNAIDKFKPTVIFNLLEEFDGEVLFDQNVVSYLELLRVPYTGCNPRGLMLARDKALAKKILLFHRIKTPHFQVFPKNRKVKTSKHLKYPLIVKCLTEEASLAIAKASIVYNEEKLKERVKYINQKIGVDAIVEEFIEGREFYVGVMGNYKTQTLPVWELKFENVEKPEKELYSNRAKWNNKYRDRKGIKTEAATLSPELELKIKNICKKVYKHLNLNGYARVDLRMNPAGEVYVIEVNPNPNIAREDELASSALHSKVNYEQLITKILKLAKSWAKKV